MTSDLCLKSTSFIFSQPEDNSFHLESTVSFFDTEQNDIILFIYISLNSVCKLKNFISKVSAISLPVSNLMSNMLILLYYLFFSRTPNK